MDTFARRLQFVIVTRTLLTTIIFLSVYLTDVFTGQPHLAELFYTVLAGFLALNLLLLPLNNLPPRFFPWVVIAHQAVDFSLISFIVFVTWDPDRPFGLLYIFLIMYTGLFQYARGVLLVTGLCCLSFVAVNLFYLLPEGVSGLSAETAKAQILVAEIHILGFVLVGLLTGFLAERLRQSGLRMAQQSGRIQDLQEYNESILASLRSGLLTTDRDFQVVKINQKGRELLGLPPAAPYGNALDLFHLGPAERMALQADTRPAPDRVEKWLRRQGGAPLYVGLSWSPLLVRGGAGGYIFTFQDLTEIKRLQDEVLVQKKMVAIGNLSAAMAHEIRNPLAAMSGSIQVLRGQLNLTEAQRHLMEIVLRESQRLDRIIRNFLQFAGAGRLDFHPLDLLGLVEETLTLFGNTPGVRQAHRLELVTEAAAMPIHGDADRLRQVFWNLFTNAVKAMPDGGRLTVNGRTEGGSHFIECVDTGRGMDEEERQHLFEPFRGRFKDGHGLGMAIAYRIVADHGGRIEVDSQPDEGTTIRLILPTAPPPEEHPS